MERIQVDFAMQRGHEMIIRRDPPFARADLDEVDLQMLQAERPPGLLAVDWFEMDGSVTFRYAIDGRKLLSHWLITGSFGMNEYISLMLGIVEALDNCGHYLLRESCCLLEEKFLFIGGDWRDVALTYIPLREPHAKKPIREELLGLAVRLMGKVERVDGEVVQTMLRLLDDPPASWSKLRVGLLQLLVSEPRGASGSPNADNPRATPYAHPASSLMKPENSAPHVAERSDCPQAPGAVHAPDHADNRTGEAIEWHVTADDGEQPDGPAKNRFDLLGKIIRREEPADTPPPETSMFDEREWPGTTGRIRDAGRARWLSASGAILAVALIWRYIYLPSPGTDRLLISLGATLLAAGGLFLLWQRLAARSHGPLDDSQSAGASGGIGDPEAWRPDAESGGRSDDAGIRNDAAELRFPWLADFVRDNHQASDAAFAVHAATGGSGTSGGIGAGMFSRLPEGMEAEGSPGMTGVGTADEETGLLADETVLLHQDGRGRQGGMYLLREHEGGHRRIPVEPGVTVIGRSETHAVIVDTAEGVSRAHLEIEFDGNDVKIKDLASRNGTLLGGEIMVPYKEYLLQDGGTFRLAGPDGPKYTLRKSG